MPTRTSETSVPLSAGDPGFAADLDHQIAEMRRLLAAMEPPTTAAALRTLRDAFPDIPLVDRLRALQGPLH